MNVFTMSKEALPQLSLYCLAFPHAPSVMCKGMCQ